MYNIIASGSKGNATILKNIILIDCGVSFKSIKPFYKKLKLVLLTHEHSDHFNKSTIRTLAKERPTLRFACCKWFVNLLIDAGVDKKNIDILEFDKTYNYGIVKVITFELFHNVSNCGYKIIFKDYKVIYATDTNKIETQAKGYNLYLIEANYDEVKLQERIKEKEEQGLFVYEYDLPNKHLSLQKCNEFLYSNMSDNSAFVYMHKHNEEDY